MQVLKFVVMLVFLGWMCGCAATPSANYISVSNNVIGTKAEIYANGRPGITWLTNSTWKQAVVEAPKLEIVDAGHDMAGMYVHFEARFYDLVTGEYLGNKSYPGTIYFNFYEVLGSGGYRPNQTVPNWELWDYEPPVYRQKQPLRITGSQGGQGNVLPFGAHYAR